MKATRLDQCATCGVYRVGMLRTPCGKHTCPGYEGLIDIILRRRDRRTCWGIHARSCKECREVEKAQLGIGKGPLWQKILYWAGFVAVMLFLRALFSGKGWDSF